MADAARGVTPGDLMTGLVIGLLLLISGVIWVGVTALNTSTGPGPYVNEIVHSRSTGEYAPSVSTPSTNEGPRVRVYFDTMAPDEEHTDWYRVWLLPALVLVAGAATLIGTAFLAWRAVAHLMDPEATARSRT